MNEMPVISRCEANGCFYNHDDSCHAPAINVGRAHPKCDTYEPSANHIGRKPAGRVGACHVAECKHNSELTCTARAIVVGRHQDHPDCITFDPTR